MRSLTAGSEDGYCSITIANHRLVTVVRFVAKNYTHPWKVFANRFHLIHYTCNSFCKMEYRGKTNNTHVLCTITAAIDSVSTFVTVATNVKREMSKGRQEQPVLDRSCSHAGVEDRENRNQISGGSAGLAVDQPPPWLASCRPPTCSGERPWQPPPADQSIRSTTTNWIARPTKSHRPELPSPAFSVGPFDEQSSSATGERGLNFVNSLPIDEYWYEAAVNHRLLFESF